MKWLPDGVIENLRRVANLPDLEGTRYTAVELVDRGGMAAVYRAHDSELGRDVALKVLHLEDPAGEAVAGLLREARTLAALEHPNIVPVYDAGRLPDGRMYYTMLFVRGRRLDEHRAGGLRLPDALRIFERACEAVAFAHSRGVVHRDLKPSNIMVGAFGEVLVMDWGVARHLAEPAETQGLVIGTPSYMAPEQRAGKNAAVGERTDVYALGAILWFLVTGAHPPVAGVSAIPRAPAGFPKPLHSVCRQAMAETPGARYPTARELAADVLAYLDGERPTAHRETVLERLSRFASNNRTLLLLIAAYLIVRFGLLFFSLR